MEAFMITTTDNPFDPFEEFDKWLAFDNSKGYGTSSYLARVALSSDDLSPLDETLAINAAVEEIVELNVLGIYKKVSKEIDLSS